jgi:hypothetical protein
VTKPIVQQDLSMQQILKLMEEIQEIKSSGLTAELKKEFQDIS